MQRSYEGPTENRLGELGSLYKYYYYYYSGTPLIRPPTGHENLVVLTGWSY